MGLASSSNVLPTSNASMVPSPRTSNQEVQNKFDFDENHRQIDADDDDDTRSNVRSSTCKVSGESRPQMTYAARTTNWRGLGEPGDSAFKLQQRENLELSQIILQLAKANQQLAGAHTAALAQLEGLYYELQKERSTHRSIPNNDGNAIPRKRLTTSSQDTRDERDEDEDVRRNLERRLDRLESVLSCRMNEQRSFMSDRVSVHVDESAELFPRIGRGSSCTERSINRGNSLDDPLVGERTSRRNENAGVTETRSSSCNVYSRLDKATDRRANSSDEQEHVERLTNDEIIKLLEEIRALKTDKVEYQRTNERLIENLAEQKIYTEKLAKDYELEKDSVAARVSSLEENLKKAIFEKEQLKKTQDEEISKLKAQLAQELEDKKKHEGTLGDALNEIQRLKDDTKTDLNIIREIVTKNDDTDCTQPADELPDNSTTDRETNLDLFKKELILKREARQKAIAAVSSEMERLRQDLEAEKEAHSETSRILDHLRSSTQNSLQSDAVVCEKCRQKTKSSDNGDNRDENEMLLRRIDAQRLSCILKVSDELRNNIRFQMEKVDDLRYQLESESDQHRYQIRCLTDVTNKTRDSLKTRERRANELKDYLARYLVRMNDIGLMDFKDDVSAECERQLESINSLKSLYNERLKVLSELKDTAVKELIDVKDNFKYSTKQCESLEEDLRKAEEKIDAQDTEISSLESQLGLTKADCRDLQNQMSLINSLFTQMLVGASSADMDLDRLSQLLQENRDLITDIARDDGTEAAALPKLLLDLVEQVGGTKESQKRNESDQMQEEIAQNLPKVWRVLLELLSVHATASHNQNNAVSESSSSDSNSCYKSVDTPSGPKLVISVSKTYIHLKELILEKKHLEKEMNRMKQLNTHLESKLGEQEKRLSAVTAELSKTWGIVGRMQAQHQQLHTHEKILRYELQQKRELLQELKLELEYCRETWESARQKNTNTELQWRNLRREFAARKMLSAHDSVNNSAESGFSDGRCDDSEEDDVVDDRVRLGLPRRPRKESPKTSAVDVELEQSIDVGLSDSGGSSSIALTNQVPAKEQETELGEKVLDSSVGSEDNQESDLVSEVMQQTLDPLDQALTTVIRNLIRIEDDAESSSDEYASGENITLPFMRLVDSVRSENNLQGSNDDLMISKECPDDDNEVKESTDIESPCPESNTSTSETSSNVETDITCSTNDINLKSNLDTEDYQDNEKTSESLKEFDEVKNTDTVSSTPIFSIGPFPVNRNSSSPNQVFTPFFNPIRETNGTVGNGLVESQKLEEESSEVKNDIERNVDLISSSDSKESAESSKELDENTDKISKTKSDSAISNPEEVLTAREDRLKRLEEQAQWLMKKMNATSRRGSALSTKLEALHETYGEASSPSVPDILQNRNSQSTPPSSPSQPAESTNDDTKSSQASSEDKDVSESLPDDDKTSS